MATTAETGMGAGMAVLGDLLVPLLLLQSDLTDTEYLEWLADHGIEPILYEVPLDSPVYVGVNPQQASPDYDIFNIQQYMPEPTTVPQGLLFKTGQINGQCVATMPKTRGVKKLKTQAVIAFDAARLMLIAYDRGFADGASESRRASTRCPRISAAMRRFDTTLKQALLSQTPSFPRKKSKTGVTRQGRKRKGPG